MSLIVYGASDDLVEVDGDVREEFNPGDGPSYLAISDGTVLRVTYDGRWRIDRIAEGAAHYQHEAASSDEGHRDDEYGTPRYSDRVTLTLQSPDAAISWVVFGDRCEGRAVVPPQEEPQP